VKAIIILPEVIGTRRVGVRRWIAIIAAGVSAAAFAQDHNNERARVPHVKSVSPAVGAKDVDPNLHEIRVTFDMSMNHAGYSFVGGGPLFPSGAGVPYWADAYTCVLPVKLRPQWEYRFGINSQSFKNFRSVWLVPAEPLECRFKTAGMGSVHLEPAKQHELNIQSLDALIDALRTKYSYFDLRNVRWEQLFAKHRPDIVAAKTTERWVRQSARMLASVNDIHMTLRFDGHAVPTAVRDAPANFDRRSVRAIIPGVTELNRSVAAGVTSDGIGYVLITTWSADAAGDVQAAGRWLEAHRTAPGLVIDVRPNAGGSETLARSIASWFVGERRVYAKHTYRRGSGPSDFTPVRERTIEPNDAAHRYDGPVAVLMGRHNVSSCEAFLLMMKQAKRAVLIGETSYGSSGNPQTVFLPNGVKVMLPSWKAMTPDGRCFEGVGIAPDIKVGRDHVDFAKSDPILTRALRWLRTEAPR